MKPLAAIISSIPKKAYYLATYYILSPVLTPAKGPEIDDITVTHPDIDRIRTQTYER